MQIHALEELGLLIWCHRLKRVTAAAEGFALLGRPNMRQPVFRSSNVFSPSRLLMRLLSSIVRREPPIKLIFFLVGNREPRPIRISRRL